jgi:hypothetical protein
VNPVSPGLPWPSSFRLFDPSVLTQYAQNVALVQCVVPAV